ncbi:MAG: hypothetical protein ACT4P3_12505 [Betaproteobacteria bacterium]
MKRVADWVAILAAGLLAACATEPAPPEAPKAPIRDNLIVPGIRVGAAALGMTETNLLQWVGKPTRIIDVPRGHPSYYYEDLGLQVQFSGGKARHLDVHKGPWRTADGIGPGTPIVTMRLAWGAPKSRVEDMGVGRYCFANGVGALVNLRSETVTNLYVQTGGCK